MRLQGLSNLPDENYRLYTLLRYGTIKRPGLYSSTYPLIDTAQGFYNIKCLI